MGAHVAIETGMRIDKLLWFLRLACSRSYAQGWASEGHIRLNGRRIERPSATVRQGDVLVLPLHDAVRVIEVLAIPGRRGPAPEAQACYRFVETGHISETGHFLKTSKQNLPGRPDARG